MPLDIQVGTLADRLRQLLKLSGRIPLRLDETTVPVAIAADASEPPYATEPVLSWLSNSSAAVAGEFSALAIALPTTADGSLVVDKIFITNDGVAARAYQIVLDHISLLGTLTDFGPFTRVNALDSRILAGNVLQSAPPHQLVGSDAGGPHLGFLLFVNLIVPANSVLRVDGPWVLPPGGAVAVWNLVANTNVIATFGARWYAGVRG